MPELNLPFDLTRNERSQLRVWKSAANRRTHRHAPRIPAIRWFEARNRSNAIRLDSSTYAAPVPWKFQVVPQNRRCTVPLNASIIVRICAISRVRPDAIFSSSIWMAFVLLHVTARSGEIFHPRIFPRKVRGREVSGTKILEWVLCKNKRSKIGPCLSSGALRRVQSSRKI